MLTLKKELFINAHRNTSFSPEKRGEQLYNDMAEMLASDLAELGDKAGNYARKFEMHLALYLGRKSRTASAMIVGPAKFPFSSNSKKIDSEMRAWESFTAWRSRYFKAAFRVKTKSPEEEIDGALEDLETLTTVRELLKQCNKLKTIEQRRAFILEHETTFKKYHKGAHLVWDETLKTHSFTLPYLGRTIKERELKLKVMRERVERKASFEPIQFNGGKITIEEDRVMIRHDEKPAREVIEKLKGRGFRWSPNWGAWVRKHTNAALWDAQSLVGAA